MADDAYTSDRAGDFAKSVERILCCPLDRNLFALMCADMLARGKCKNEIDDIAKFLQLVISLLKSYDR